jgi:beta-glucosidase
MSGPASRMPTRSRLASLSEHGAFCWATGIEDTFVVEAWPGSGRSLDEYELTRHYECWRADLARVACLGVRAVRYGIPWHRAHLGPGRFDWRFADETLGFLLDQGIEPIVDLVHYGTPPWLRRSFLDPDYPRHVAEYAGALAERFRGRLHWFTPMNEPRIAAWYAGKIGWWPPGARGWSGFARVLIAACRGVRETCAALRAVDPELVMFHVDATDLYETTDPALAPEALRRQSLVFLALDLLTGRVDESHPLRSFLLAHVGEDEVDEFRVKPLELDLLGINLYPMFSRKRLARRAGRLRVRQIAAGPEILTRLASLYHERYACPLMVSETAALGSHARRLRWMRDSVAAVRDARAHGIPLVGYTWWPMFALVAWAYRQSGARELDAHLLQMGLWDLDPRDLGRVHTPLVDAYRELVAQGSRAVGALAAPASGALTPPAPAQAG